MIEAKTAHEAIKKTMNHIIAHGWKSEVWGGEIPAKIGDPNSPNDFDREMIECEPLVIELSNPLARWSDYSSHNPGITLRETEDSLQQYNPGYVVAYSKLYNVWLNKHNLFDYTYGERIFSYPYHPATYRAQGVKDAHVLCANQFYSCVELLKKHPSTRKAVISIGFPFVDHNTDYRPCNQLFQLRVVDGKLNWITVVRSLDVLRGFTENIFMFSIMQEMAASQLKVPVGTYTTVALNPHIYKEQLDDKLHLQKVPDCYDAYNPRPAFESPFPSETFKRIDHMMFDRNRISDAVKVCDTLPRYWKDWKLSLIAEWERLHKHYDLAELISRKITNEFGIRIRQKLKERK